ncbi:hypothetical protein [Luedemannella helvata]|uniref:Integral membrane protein n=1 Tax=Luedemannella helvata TaxID=349315 RepID=A0ABP4WCZ1_9ACTN
MRERLIRAVLALYPAAMRERYGDEIADLLARSHRPGHDLVDAARAGLTERAGALTWPHLRKAAKTVGMLIVVPVALGSCMVAAITVAVVAVGTISPAAPHGAVIVCQSLAAAPVALLARRWALRLGRSVLVAAPAVVVPAALGATILAMALGPAVVLPGDAVSDVLRSYGSAVAVWATALIGTALTANRVRTRFGARAAGWVAVVGAFVALELATITNVLASTDATHAPRGRALLWFPAAIGGLDDAVTEAAGVLPIMLTLCSVFTLVLTAALARRQATRAAPMPAA